MAHLRILSFPAVAQRTEDAEGSRKSASVIETKIGSWLTRRTERIPKDKRPLLPWDWAEEAPNVPGLVVEEPE